ncbi:MAG: hypothetical protein O7G29_13050 [Acidobacteria bacterium]|nr:hypothetical protein [Acidobacteriota bacterium]
MPFMKLQMGLFFILLVLAAACQSSTSPPSELRVGMSKAEVLELLGPPGVRGTLVKQTESIWGPQEEWWDQVEMGGSLETWSYLYPGEGTQFVYFLDELDTVSFTAYTPDGVVY